MQKQMDEAAKQSQEQIKSLSEETTMLRRGIDESSMFPQSIAEWTSSEQHEEMFELNMNNIALKGVPERHGESAGSCHAELGS